MKKTFWSVQPRSVGGLTLALILIKAPCALATEFTLETATNAVAKGDPQAEYFLAKHYAKGQGVPRDYVKAAEYMQKAAEAGVVFAQNDLGVLYAKGQGVKRDLVEATKWYRKAAENGDPLGQFSLGRSCAEGRGVATNMTEAIKWYQRAAAQNEPDAILALGYLYQDGQGGISEDDGTACQWFEKAAALGHVEVLNNVGLIYESGGHGVKQDLEQAVKCYRMAAEKNNALGQMNLGRMYQDGLGVKSDPVAAYEWFYLACRNGEGVANHYLMDLTGGNPMGGAGVMTDEQIQEAIRRANAFKMSLAKKS